MDERLEPVRAEVMIETFNTLLAILKDEKHDVAMRLKAAKQIDGMSDTMVHAYLLQNAVQEDSSTKRKLLSSMDKLHGHGDE